MGTSKLPLMGRSVAATRLIDTKPGPASGRGPKQQGWPHWGLVAKGQGVAEF
jgi:hypothetical protein